MTAVPPFIPKEEIMILRSQQWLAGADEVALAHRVALRSIGLDVDVTEPRPLIGIADSSSELNPCNLPLRALADAAAEGIKAAGGLPVRFPTMSLGEDLMKPSAFLYRNLLAMEIEETIRSNPLDGIVVLANCDKTVPAVLMGAASTNLPTIAVLGGARPVTTFRGKSVGTGTDLWRLWEERRAGEMDDAGWKDLETCLACGLGACNTMGTASTMAILTEALGLALPGLSTAAAGSPESLEGARLAGERIVGLVADNIRPRDILTRPAFDNAARILHSIGGSTNAVIHLAAIAGRVGLTLDLNHVSDLGRGLPLLADVEPSGDFLIHDFHTSGGLPVVQKQLIDHLDFNVITVSEKTLHDVVSEAAEASGAIRTVANALGTDGSLAVLFGNLAPDGAVIKKSAAAPSLFSHTGPALVFHSYEDMR
jgi:dihydroxyacid dehydratase/phosphogluconate dehydratase